MYEREYLLIFLFVFYVLIIVLYCTDGNLVKSYSLIVLQDTTYLLPYALLALGSCNLCEGMSFLICKPVWTGFGWLLSGYFLR